MAKQPKNRVTLDLPQEFMEMCERDCVDPAEARKAVVKYHGEFARDK